MSGSTESDRAADHNVDVNCDDPDRRPLPKRSTWHVYHTVTARICRSNIQVLLLLVPVGIVAGILGLSDAVVFFLNLLAIIPLIAWINLSISVFSTGVGQLLDELLKANLGNALEVLIGFIAISQGQVRVAQSVLLGSILCYLLLVLGGCFFISGYDKKRIQFDRTLTSILSSLMMVVSISLIIPTITNTFPSSERRSGHNSDDILAHTTAIVLVLLLSVFLFFQLRTHACIFDLPADNRTDRNESEEHPVEVELPLSLGFWPAGCILIAASLCVLSCSSLVVRSIGGVAKAFSVSQAFIGLVVIPLLGNSTKYFMIVATARKNKVDLGVRAVMSSVLRMTLLVAPFLVLLGWIYDEPLTLRFDDFEAIVFFIGIMVMIYIVQDGRSNYFEGLMLIGTYLITTLSFYIRPTPPENVIFLGR